MLKSELILRLAARHKHLVQQDAEFAVNLIVGAMIDALAHGRRIEIREFGSFSLRERKARKGRNPRTGASVFVPTKSRIYFRATGDLKRRVNAKLFGAIEKKDRAKPRLTEPHHGMSNNPKISSREMMNLLESAE